MPEIHEFSADMSHPQAYIHTYTGLDFRMDDPVFSLVDIAHALSQQVRWGGHCRVFYSVAEHSVIVSKLVPPEFALQGLFHDAPEAYIADMPAPWKPMVQGYEQLEDYLLEKICKWYDIPYPLDQSVKRADWRALYLEAWVLIEGQGKGWIDPHNVRGEPLPNDPKVVGLNPPEAKELWLERYEELCSAGVGLSE